jgi:hypothetical protein
MHLVQHRDAWWAFVNTVMNLRILYSAENFLTELQILEMDYASWRKVEDSKGNGKGRFVPLLYAMKAYWRVEV